ncbi:DUF3888 domain-containing protein [Bacillus sp. EB01]|uniref:DUF3888 domain-containing protein n=1 Tax=Bacillus sp. EB01 TaxID=1347086 RepID=UPI0006945DE4|nr:DUF3888 domain-containing protein [Bacillus sp. EB01]
MKKLLILILVVTGSFLPNLQANANTLIKSDDVASLQISRLSGGSRNFSEKDGIEEFVIRKVVDWVNTADNVKEPTELVNKMTPIALLKVKMKNGDVAIIEPAYNCHVQNQSTFCTLADGDVILTRNNQKVRLQSVPIFDWLLTGWKYERTKPPEDTKELMVNDILMLLLGPEIDKAVSDYYSKYFTETPSVYPYQVEIVNLERVGGFRTFHFLITLETTPVVGPHISVGKDRLIFEISPTIKPGQIKLKKFEHLETHELPPHWKDIIIERSK